LSSFSPAWPISRNKPICTSVTRFVPAANARKRSRATRQSDQNMIRHPKRYHVDLCHNRAHFRPQSAVYAQGKSGGRAV
jgi:hypothetical protein